MSKYGEMFKAEIDKANKERQDDQTKNRAQIEMATARKDEEFRPLRERILPHLQAARSQLPSRVVKLELEPVLNSLSDDRPHLMFQLVGSTGRQPTSVYKFTLLNDGTVIADMCKPQAPRNTADRQLMKKNIEEVKEADVAEVIRIAFEEFAKVRK